MNIEQSALKFIQIFYFPDDKNGHQLLYDVQNIDRKLRKSS